MGHGKGLLEKLRKKDCGQYVVFGLMLAGFVLALISGFVPWYDIYVFYWSELRGIQPWFVTEMRCLSSEGPIVAGVSGLVLAAALLSLWRRSNSSVNQSAATLGVLLLPWIGTPSLYFLIGHPLSQPWRNWLWIQVVGYSFVPRIGLGFWLNLAATAMVTMAIVGALWRRRSEKQQIRERRQALARASALLSLAALLMVDAYVPWLNGSPEVFVPWYLLPLTLGASLCVATLLSYRIDSRPMQEIILAWTGFMVLSAATKAFDISRLGGFPHVWDWTPAELLLAGIGIATTALGIRWSPAVGSRTAGARTEYSQSFVSSSFADAQSGSLRQDNGRSHTSVSGQVLAKRVVAVLYFIAGALALACYFLPWAVSSYGAFLVPSPQSALLGGGLLVAAVMTWMRVKNDAEASFAAGWVGLGLLTLPWILLPLFLQFLPAHGWSLAFGLYPYLLAIAALSIGLLCAVGWFFIDRKRIRPDLRSSLQSLVFLSSAATLALTATWSLYSGFGGVVYWFLFPLALSGTLLVLALIARMKPAHAIVPLLAVWTGIMLISQYGIRFDETGYFLLLATVFLLVGGGLVFATRNDGEGKPREEE